MKWEQALRQIESDEFDASVNVVSSMRAFFWAAAQEPVVGVLYRYMVESGEAREGVLGRICDLSQLEVDRRYENPNDTPLAILLWLTRFTSADYAYIAADLVDRAPQCWYAKKLARRILVPAPVRTGNSWVEEPQPSRTCAGVDSGDLTVTINPIAKNVRRFTHDGASTSATTSGEISAVGNALRRINGNLIIGRSRP